MQGLSYDILVWLTYRLAASFAIGIPLLLLIWACIRKEASMMRLLVIYWKVASLLFISMLLLTDQKAMGYLTAFIAPILMVISVWFWVDLNEELADLPPWRPLPLTVRIWRWALSCFCILATLITFISLPCIQTTSLSQCASWLEAPQGIHQLVASIFGFLFGGNWTEPVAAFVGYLGLLAYVVGLYNGYL